MNLGCVESSYGNGGATVEFSEGYRCIPRSGRLAGVDAHAHPELSTVRPRVPRECALRLYRGTDGILSQDGQVVGAPSVSAVDRESRTTPLRRSQPQPSKTGHVPGAGMQQKSVRSL